MEGGWGQTECVECQAKTILAIKANGACQKQFMWPKQKESRERERERCATRGGRWQLTRDKQAGDRGVCVCGIVRHLVHTTNEQLKWHNKWAREKRRRNGEANEAEAGAARGAKTGSKGRNRGRGKSRDRGSSRVRGRWGRGSSLLC